MLEFADLLASLCTGIALLFGVLMLASLGKGNFRVWPPPSRNSWQFRVCWTVNHFLFAGVGLSGILAWNSGILPSWVRYAIGLPALIGGFGFAIHSVKVLGYQTSLGLGGPLVSAGPYRFSRNPQYLGDMIGIVGWILCSNAPSAVVPGLLGAGLFLIVPFLEEPWLREQYGESYEDYRSKVPRFIGLRLGKSRYI